MMKKQSYIYVNGLSDLGSRMQLIAMTALILTFENSAFWLTAFFAARQVGGILSSLYAGVLADRMDRRRLMIGSDLVCGAMMAAVVIVPEPWFVILTAFVVGVLFNVFQVSFSASIPQVFGEDRVLETNALIVRLASAASIVGFTAGGLLADRFGYQAIILFDASTFFISAVVLMGLKWNSAPEQSGKRLELVRDLREVFAYIWKRPIFLLPSLLLLIYSLGTTAWNYGLPMVSGELPDNQSTMHGLMWSMVGLGSFVGSFLAGRWKVKLLPALLLSLAAGAVLYTAAFATDLIPVMLVFLFLAGLVDAGIQMYHRTIMQESENEIRGRVFGVQALMNRLGFLAGFAMMPWLVGSYSLLGMVLIINGVVLLAVLLTGVQARGVSSRTLNR